ncbi:DNA-repair protein XRCC1 [Linum grandiflorum]
MSSGDSGGNKRSLPSWITSDDNATRKDKDGSSPLPTNGSSGPSSSSPTFSKLLEGVVFVLSGFVNPERATLRSHALEMGADYRPDWGSDSTLLICAYSNTPKFRQVEALCGTIVRKEWVLECYNQKKLLEIDSYLMHAGKPWRKTRDSAAERSNEKERPRKKIAKEAENLPHSGPSASASSNSKTSKPAKEKYPSSEVKKWAVNDLNKTISWLESQDEKPEPSEINQIAAEGIIICLQDAIDAIEKDQDICKIVNQWNVVPRAIEELAKLSGGRNESASCQREGLCKQAKEFKETYEVALRSSEHNSNTHSKRMKNSAGGGNGKGRPSDGYDSDETIEMTEEEICVASKLCA